WTYGNFAGYNKAKGTRRKYRVPRDEEGEISELIPFAFIHCSNGGVAMIGFKTPTRTSKEQFDRQADYYDAQWNAWSKESLAWLLDHADATLEDVVLDVATGTGFIALAFASRVRSVVGLDVSPGMMAKARQQAQEQGIVNVTFQEGSAELL